MKKLELRELCVSIQNVPILRGIDLSVEQGEFLSLLGPSGCGKSTLLKTVAGILPADRGTIFMNGRDISRLPVHKRDTVVVFQDMRLFPNMSVLDNVAFPLKMQRLPKFQRRAVAQELLAHVQMEDYGNRRISEISGGQQQRVALARALAAKPQLLLLDEPFSALDENLRGEIRALVKGLHRDFGMTTVLVTHDREEALSMSDRVAVMFDGQIAQIDSPREVYTCPLDRRVADYFGNCVYIRGQVTGGQFRSPYAVCSAALPDGDYDMLLRYDALKPDTPGSYRAVVSSIRFLGAQTAVTFRSEDGLLWEKTYSGAPQWEIGQPLLCTLDISQPILFPRPSHRNPSKKLQNSPCRP